LKRRIKEIHETIGEDAVILDESERLNDGAMYAIYEERAETLSEHEDDEGLDVNPLAEAEELLREIKASDPALFNRIATMRDG